ncbi:MAG: magnesium protoporphyrin IX methyltransferase [Pseudorhodobacter sp.]|nr:magnesium protoporphyrin IX methyltransferase [Rhizobacter sp.]
METTTYVDRRGQIKNYFDRTAVAAWATLTSDAPVGRIRTTVRAGRNQMRNTLLSWLPEDLHGRRILDAGCGTGALAVEAARRGAEVVAIDLSPTLVNLARDRLPTDLRGTVDFHSGDMLDEKLGRFDHVVAMDSIIHYDTTDAVKALSQLAERTSTSIVFTYAPRTPLLATMIAIGRLLPRGDRAPWLEPMAKDKILSLMVQDKTLNAWQAGRTQRVSSGFYKSQALELKKS